MTALVVALEAGDRYVAAAYVVFVALIVVYVAIMAAKLQRIERELASLTELAERRFGRGDHMREKHR